VNDTIQQTPADSATDAAIETVVTHAAPEQQEAAFNRASIEHRRSAPSDEGSRPTDQSWRDGSELAPMPAAPAVTSETDAAVSKLNALGGRHSELLSSWGNDAPANLEYARAAFRDVAANDPELIAAVDRSGLGNHPSVLEILARQGRLTAGLMGDHTITRRNNDMTTNPVNRAGPTGTNRGGSAREQLDELMAANPPGSDKYKSPAIQRKVESLSRQISGGGSIIGSGGRTS
jgi:hypothetical protein